MLNEKSFWAIKLRFVSKSTYRFSHPMKSYLLFDISTATSALILKTEHDHNRLSSLSGDNILGTGVRIGRGEDAVAVGNKNIMDSAQSAMMKQSDYVVG